MTVQMVSEVPARILNPEPYDFARPMTLQRERAGALTRGSESFARSWHTDLSAKLRQPCRISVLDVAIVTWDDYVARLPEMTAMVVCTIAGMDGRGVLQFPLPETIGWTSLMLGATSAPGAVERPFTAVEHAIVARLAADAFSLLHYTFGADFPESMSVESIQYSPQSAKAAGPVDPMVVTTWEIAVGDTVSTITLAMPERATTAPDLPMVNDAKDPAELVLAQLQGVPVRIALQFDATRVRPGAVLTLAEGDLIRLSHSKNRPLNFAVEGQVLAKAAVGASGAQLACVIVDTQETP